MLDGGEAAAVVPGLRAWAGVGVPQGAGAAVRGGEPCAGVAVTYRDWVWLGAVLWGAAVALALSLGCLPVGQCTRWPGWLLLTGAFVCLFLAVAAFGAAAVVRGVAPPFI